MKKMRSSKGTSVLGAIIAVMILAAMGAAMASLVVTNQETWTRQYYADQSFASVQAALEVVLGLIRDGANPCGSLDRNLSGDSVAGSNIVVTRTGGRIYITASKGDASTSVSIVDPYPPDAGSTLLVDTSNAKDSSNGAPPKKLIDITFQLNAGCGTAVTIVTMMVTWTPNLGEKIQQIKLDGNNIFNGSSISGDLIDITDTTISDASIHTLDFIRWDGEIQNRLYTIQFNYSDGTNKIVTVDTR